MTFKAFFRLLGKALDPSRPDIYYQTLVRRFYKKIYNTKERILRKCKELPEYVYKTPLLLLQASRLYTYTNDFEKIKYKIRCLDNTIKICDDIIDDALSVINESFPAHRKDINFKYNKFLVVTDCHLHRHIGYVANVTERGNGIDFYFVGKFFDTKGNPVIMDVIDKTYLVEVMTKNEDFTRYINLYSKELSKKPLGVQQAEMSLLYDAWNTQLNYLIQIENEERSL